MSWFARLRAALQRWVTSMPEAGGGTSYLPTGPAPTDAGDISFDPTGSGLVSTNVQAVVLELAAGAIAGPSAYDVWLLAGNVGTEDDFLDSLKGAAGPAGTPGTSLTWLASVANAAALPAGGNTTGDARITDDTGHLHRWSGAAWVDVGQVRGAGLVAGGTVGQLVVKLSGTDYDVGFASLVAGTGVELTGTTFSSTTVPLLAVGTGRTFALADAGKVVEYTGAGQATFTIPPNSTAAFAIGTVIEMCRCGAGALLVAAGSGVTLQVPAPLLAKARGQWSTMSVRKRATNEWVLSGDLAAS